MNEQPNNHKYSKSIHEKKLKEESKLVKADSMSVLKDFEEIDNIDKTTKKC